MIDALGRPQTVLLLGGTSEIGLAILRALPAQRLRWVVLAARDGDAAGAYATRLQSVWALDVQVDVRPLETTDTASHADLIDNLFDVDDIDVIILATGALGDQAAALTDPAVAVALAHATYVGPVSLLLHVARRLRQQGHGTVVVLSSLAAAQARPANFLYGSAKAGLDHAARGVWDALDGTGANLVLVRPGFVRSRMTAHLPVPPLAVRPDDVGRAVVRAITGPSRVVYVPRVGAVLGALLAHLPRPILRRMPF